MNMNWFLIEMNISLASARKPDFAVYYVRMIEISLLLIHLLIIIKISL